MQTIKNRVLHVVGQMNIGGQEVFIMNVYRSLNKENIQFDFLVHISEEGHFDKEIEIHGGKIFYVIPKSKNFIKNLFDTYKLLVKLKGYLAIHIHTNFSISFFDAYLAKLAGWKNIIVHSHSTKTSKGQVGSFIHYLLRPLLNLVITHRFASSLDAGIWLFGKEQKENIRVLKQGIDTKSFVYNELIRHETREFLNLKDEIVIGHVGRFVDEKNHLFIVDIFVEYLKFNPSSKLVLVGDGILRENVQKYVSDLNLSNKVIFVGEKDNVNKYYCAFDLFLFPSKVEGFGIVLIEAQSTGLRCFVSDSVPIQVKLTDLLVFISLKQPASLWANEIHTRLISKTISRENFKNNIIKAGYDIEEITIWLEKVYKNSINN